MNRPDYVSCVGFGDAVTDDDKKTWCGRKESPHFVDVNHAALNGKQEGRLIVCGECRHEIIKALSNGCTYV